MVSENRCDEERVLLFVRTCTIIGQAPKQLTSLLKVGWTYAPADAHGPHIAYPSLDGLYIDGTSAMHIRYASMGCLNALHCRGAAMSICDTYMYIPGDGQTP